MEDITPGKRDSAGSLGRRKRGRKVPAPPPSLTGTVTFEQRLDRRCRGRKPCRGTAFPARGTANAKLPRWEPARPLGGASKGPAGLAS